MEKQKIVTLSERSYNSERFNPTHKSPDIERRLKEFKITNLEAMQINNECFEQFYDCLSILGIGAFGIVISAVDKSDGEVYAIKVNSIIRLLKRIN